MNLGFPDIKHSHEHDPPTVFLPGWGFDSRILQLIKPSPGWVGPGSFPEPATTELEILEFIAENKLDKIRIIGWSLGAMLGLDFASHHPHKTESLVLVGLRSSWPREEIQELQQNFTAQPVSFLKEFYRKCFLGDRRSYQAFCTTLEPLYLHEAERCTEQLLNGLKFLGEFTYPDPMPAMPTLLIHGGQDIIAPVSEMPTLAGAKAEIIAKTGHAAFLAQDCSLQKELKKKAIQHKFSRAADSYDRYAKVQGEVALELAEKLPQPDEFRGEKRILELGCGTGNFTARLAERYPDARITALDFSREMLAKAEDKMSGAGIDFVHAEAEQYLEICSAETFDLVASNGSLQWFADLGVSLENIARALKPGGILACSIFGPDSLRKLGLGLKELFQYDGNVAASGFPDTDSLQQCLNKCFSSGKLEQALIEKQYDSVHDLLVHIRKTGTGGWNRDGAPALTPARLKQLDNWFVKNFGRCMVTYQVYFLKAVK